VCSIEHLEYTGGGNMYKTLEKMRKFDFFYSEIVLPLKQRVADKYVALMDMVKNDNTVKRLMMEQLFATMLMERVLDFPEVTVNDALFLGGRVTPLSSRTLYECLKSMFMKNVFQYNSLNYAEDMFWRQRLSLNSLIKLNKSDILLIESVAEKHKTELEKISDA